MVWRGTYERFIIMNHVAVLSNSDKGVSDIAEKFECSLKPIFFLPLESGPVPFDKFLSPLSSYPTSNVYFPY